MLFGSDPTDNEQKDRVPKADFARCVEVPPGVNRPNASLI